MLIPEAQKFILGKFLTVYTPTDWEASEALRENYSCLITDYSGTRPNSWTV
jgi:hypothetical protein